MGLDVDVEVFGLAVLDLSEAREARDRATSSSICRGLIRQIRCTEVASDSIVSLQRRMSAMTLRRSAAYAAVP